MKSLHKTAFAIYLLINFAKCHVHNQTKTDTAIKIKENDTVEIVEAKPTKVEAKNVSSEYSKVYLEDVFYSLKNQNWSRDQEKCLNQTLLMLTGLKNFTLWAVWQWDAISSEPVGLLYGSRFQLGNFDECMNAPWRDSHPELQSQYCLANIDLHIQRVTKKNKKITEPYVSTLDFMKNRPKHTRTMDKLHWGACVPSSCNPASVEKLMTIMLARSHLGTAGIVPKVSVSNSCQVATKSYQYGGLFYSFWILAIVLVAVCITCTCINSRESNNSDELKSRIIQAFCLRENCRNLLQVKRDGIEVLYGMRYLTMCLIVLDHQVGIMNSGPVSDGTNFDTSVFSVIGNFMLHNDLFVDTFFFMSAFLTINNFLRMKNVPHFSIMILKRYVRLTVAFAVVMFYIVAIFPHSGSGPIWPMIAESEKQTCVDNWWINLLMLGNYVDTSNICIVVSWYIPCDFHYFCITAFLFWLHKRLPKFAKTCAWTVAAVSLITPGIVNFVYKLPPAQLFTFDFVVDPRSHYTFNMTYIKSHSRMGSYVVGVLSGFIFEHYKTVGDIKRIDKKWATIGAYSGALIMLIIMIVGTLFLPVSYSQLTSAVYAAVDRPIWACGLSLLVLCCAFGTPALVKRFLSWYPWVPLSRLAYGVYLMHSMFIIRNVAVARNPTHNDFFILVNSAMGVIFWSSFTSLCIWLLTEAPINNLLTIMLTPRNKVSVDKVSADNTPGTLNSSSTSITIDGSGHYESNLPTTVQFSSKM